MSTQRRRVLVSTEISDGVYIEGLDGKFYTADNWQGGNAANSIAVVSGDVKFRMALTQSSSLKHIYSDYAAALENYMTAISDETKAKADYDGAGNTAKIMQMQPSTGYAAGYCDAFVFPDSKTKGYLPSLGQLWLACQNKEEVDAALTACGGTEMTITGYYGYWTSTFYGIRSNTGRRCCWYLTWKDNGSIEELHLNWDGWVRPFADLD